MTDAAVERLQAERDVGRQLVRFARAMDSRDWGALRAILFDDSTAELGSGPLTGSDAIVGVIRSYLDACGPSQHLLGSIEVDVDGDTATSRAYVHDVHLGPGDRGRLSFATLGDYHDQWERDAEAWRLRHRHKHNRGRLGTMAVFGLDDDATPSDREILNLVYRYPELIDAGDFAGVGELFAEGTLVFEADDGTVVGEATGADAVASTFSTVMVYDDGTPHTRHVITNPIVEIDEAGGTALCRYYITVFQRTDGFPLQPVWANRYEDHLRRVGGKWRLHRRRGFSHLPGDTSYHLRDVPDF
jgi:ketosteroid isomerase-like protein